MVESLLVKGFNTYEISSKLQISQSTISRDTIYLRQKAKEDLQNHIDDRLPYMYNQCLNGVTEVLKLAWQIASGECNDNKTTHVNCI